MQLSVRHQTAYRYNQPVQYALQKLRLRPANSLAQSVITWSVDITGGKVEASYKDHYGNFVDLVSADPEVEALTITAHGQVETLTNTGVLGATYGRAPLWHFQQATPLTTAGDGTKALSALLAKNPEPLDGLHTLSAAVLDKTPYLIGKTHADTTAEEALSIGHGVCQDHANIFIAAARAAGLPARYVSGYLMMNDRIDQDASHAWAEAHVDGLGWVGFDISNGYSPDERYIRLSVGRDSADAAPISGLRLGSSDESMIVSLQVQQ